MIRIKQLIVMGTLLIGVATSVEAGIVPPEECPISDKYLLGFYTGNGEVLLVREQQQRLEILYRYLVEDKNFNHSNIFPLKKKHYDAYSINESGPLTSAESGVDFERDQDGRGVSLRVGGHIYTRKFTGELEGQQFRFKLEQPWEALVAQSEAAVMPSHLQGKNATLVDVRKIIPDIKFNLPYATKENCFGHPLVQSAKILLDLEATNSLKKVQAKLKPYGYGLVVWEAYRPWSVFNLASTALPKGSKTALPQPNEGYSHCTGRSIAVSLWDLQAGREAVMPSGYDDFTPAQYDDYAGGTELSRWQRELLQELMEQEGFVGSKNEWWHFDYRPQEKYGQLNVPL